MGKGFLESLLPGPYKAAGMLLGAKGNLSDSDLAELGTILDAEGAFDDKD